VPELLRTLALRALAVQLMDRTRHSSVIAAISVGGQSGLLSQLMHSAARPGARRASRPLPSLRRLAQGCPVTLHAGGAMCRCAASAWHSRHRMQGVSRKEPARGCRGSGSRADSSAAPAPGGWPADPAARAGGAPAGRGRRRTRGQRPTGALAGRGRPARGAPQVAALEAPGPPAYSVAFVEALLSLVGALVSSTSGCAALSEAGLIPALLPLLRDGAPGHVGLVSAGVRILEAFMDFSPAAATLFRDLGGLSDMIRRLGAEVAPAAAGAPERPSAAGGAGAGAEAAAAAAGAGAEGGGAGGAGGAEGMQMDVAPGEAAAAAGLAGLAGGGGGGGGGGEAGDAAAPASVPYARRLLLKSLLRAIALASYAPGTGARPQVAPARSPVCMRRV